MMCLLFLLMASPGTLTLFLKLPAPREMLGPLIQNAIEVVTDLDLAGVNLQGCLEVRDRLVAVSGRCEGETEVVVR